jgi:5-methylcytosine-specific restriction endonuclease McrA
MLRDGSVETEAMWCGAEDVGGGAGELGYDERCTTLHRRLKRIVKARGALDAQEAAALRDAEALRMWRHYGYGSLLEYMEMELGYTPRAALERLRVAKAIVDLPLIAEAMEQGDLSFSAGRELTRVATADTEGEWLEAANDKNLRQVEELVAGHDRGAKPSDPKDLSLRKQKLRFDELDGETVALIRQARQILEREQGERLTDNALLRLFARMIIDGVASPERIKAPYQIAVTVCSECKRGWLHGGGITVEMSPPALETALCDAHHIGSIDRDDEEAAHVRGSTRQIGSIDGDDEQTTNVRGGTHNASIDGDDEQTTNVRGGTHNASIDGDDEETMHVGSTRQISSIDRDDAKAAHMRGSAQNIGSADGVEVRPERPARPNRANDNAVTGADQPRGRAPDRARTSSKRVRSAIPPALRRRVKHRDHYKCRVPWCRSSINVDCHHIRPIAEGGSHTFDNLLSLCESHHLAHHKGALIIEGTATSPAFRRREDNAFATVERAVDTKRALEALGFDKSEVKAAMDRTKTHVGTDDLTLQQWIKIALSYCPKPR